MKLNARTADAAFKDDHPVFLEHRVAFGRRLEQLREHLAIPSINLVKDAWLNKREPRTSIYAKSATTAKKIYGGSVRPWHLTRRLVGESLAAAVKSKQDSHKYLQPAIASYCMAFQTALPDLSPGHSEAIAHYLSTQIGRNISADYQAEQLEKKEDPEAWEVERIRKTRDFTRRLDKIQVKLLAVEKPTAASVISAFVDVWKGWEYLAIPSEMVDAIQNVHAKLGQRKIDPRKVALPDSEKRALDSRLPIHALLAGKPLPTHDSSIGVLSMRRLLTQFVLEEYALEVEG